MIEEVIGNIARAVKHFIIAASLGYEESMKELWKYYSAGNITKENLNATLRSHQSAIDATKSLQREEAEAIYQQLTSVSSKKNLGLIQLSVGGSRSTSTSE